MCCFLPRCTVIFAGIFCLLQSIVWAVLAFLGLALYTCELEVTYEKDNPVYYLYFVYFFNRKCAFIPDDLNFEKIISGTLTTPAGFTTPFPLPAWPDTFGPVEYTHNLMLGYAVLSVLWAVTSLIIIVAGAVNISSWVAYVPWIVVAVGNIILDVVATISFALQATESQTVLGLLELIGLQNIGELDEFTGFLEGIDGLTVIPSLVMALLSSRVVVFWLLNLLLVICVNMATYKLSKNKDKVSRPPPHPYYRENLTLPVENEKSTVAGSDNPAYARKYNPQSDYDYVNNNRPFSYTPDDPRMTARTSLHPPQPSVKSGLHSPAPQPVYLECLEPVDNKPQPISIASRELPQIPKEKEMNYEQGTESDVKRRAPVIPRISSDRSQYRPHPLAADLHRRRTSYEEVRPMDRKSSQTQQDRLQDPKWNSGPMTPDGVHSQMPWSYFGPRKVPMKPPVVEEELERPPVPVPDYTLHFGKTSRPSTSNWSEDGASSTTSSIMNYRSDPAPRNNSFLERSRY